MKLKLVILFLLCISSVHAQMYRWVDANGKVTYSDQPPPSFVTKQQKKAIASEESSGATLNYSLSETIKNFPVTLYTSSECAPCEDGRALLKKRGIPFSEKTVRSNEDISAMKQAGGGGQLPFIKIGRNSQTGFEAGAWNAALTAVGYPETSQLPANYKFSAPSSAAPPPLKNEKPVEAPQPVVVPAPAQETTTPRFRF